jgi:hypothetical protein
MMDPDERNFDDDTFDEKSEIEAEIDADLDDAIGSFEEVQSVIDEIDDGVYRDDAP